jgi:hypothetical protein
MLDSRFWIMDLRIVDLRIRVVLAVSDSDFELWGNCGAGWL